MREQIESEATKCNDCASSSDLFAPSSSSHPPPEAEAKSSSRPQLVKAKMAKFLPIGVRSDVMKHRHFKTGVFKKKIFGFHQLKLGPPSLPIIGSLPFITIKRGLADFAMDSAVRFSIMMCRHKQQQQFATESRRLL